MPVKVSIPYEQEAMHDMKMPKRLTDPMDQMCYLALVNLHRLYKTEVITKEKAGAQKQELNRILDDYTRAKGLRDRQTEWAENAMMKCEQVITRYNHWRLAHQDAPTGDTADLVEMLDAIVNALHPKNPEPKEEPHEGSD